MQKIVILILTLLILLVSNTDTLAKVKMLDVVHLTDGKLITYPLDQIEKKTRVEVEFKSRTSATIRAAVFPIFPVGLLSFGVPVFSGWGQFYNGQYLKAVGFLVNGFIGMNVLMASEDSNTAAVIGAGMVVGGYIWSIIDANLSAKKINELSTKKINATKLNRYQQKEVSTSLSYIPNQGLMASYNVRF